MLLSNYPLIILIFFNKKNQFYPLTYLSPPSLPSTFTMAGDRPNSRPLNLLMKGRLWVNFPYPSLQFSNIPNTKVFMSLPSLSKTQMSTQTKDHFLLLLCQNQIRFPLRHLVNKPHFLRSFRPLPNKENVKEKGKKTLDRRKI